MTDVFISYARENRELAAQLAQALQDQGLVVWWDRDIPGGAAFSDVIENFLTSARVVIVLWSIDSVRSGFVRDESARALDAGKLLPVRVENISLPLGFGQLQTLELADWRGEVDAPHFVQLLAELRLRLGQSPTPITRTRRTTPRWRGSWTAALAALILLVALALGTHHWYSGIQAEEAFQAGLKEQFDREPNLESARNSYLTALEYRPDHARARYYLAHAYAQLGQPAEARIAFERALADLKGLDAVQKADAAARVAELAPAVEPVAIARSQPSSSAASLVAPASAPQAVPQDHAEPKIIGEHSRAPVATPPVKSAFTETSVARLPRVAASATVLAKAEPLVAQMFADQSQTRITATTTLVLDPDLLSEAVPLAIERARAALTAGTAGLSGAAQSGIINTLVLLQSALPASLMINRVAIDALLVDVKAIGPQTQLQADRVKALLQQATSHRPQAFVQIANEAQRPIAESLVVRLRAAGYDAPGIEMVGARAPATSQVRVQGKSERGLARWIAKVVGDAEGVAVPVQTLRNVNPKNDTFEIWFDRDLCAAGGVQLAGCGG